MEKNHYFCREICEKMVKTMFRTILYNAFEVLTCTLLLVSCQQTTDKTGKQTNGEVKTEDTKKASKTIRQHVKYSGTFYQITNIGSPDIVFTQGPYNIEAEGSEELVNKLSVGVDQNVLTVNMKNEEKIDLTQYKTMNDRLTLYISCPTIKTIAMCGTGGFHAVGTIESDNLQLGILGTGSIEADTINAGDLSFDITGDGDAQLGQATVENNALFTLSGQGHIACSINAGQDVTIDCNSKCQIDFDGKAKQLNLNITDQANCNVDFDADQLLVEAIDGNIFVRGNYKKKIIRNSGNAKVFQQNGGKN